MKDYKQSLRYLSQDRYIQENWYKDKSVTEFLRQFRERLDQTPGQKKAEIWRKAYQYAESKKNLFLYAGLMSWNYKYIYEGRMAVR